MRKSLLVAAAIAGVLLTAPGSANAGGYVSVGIGLPFPPVTIVAPAPCYSRPIYYGRPVYGPPIVYARRHVHGPRPYGTRYYRARYDRWYR